MKHENYGSIQASLMLSSLNQQYTHMGFSKKSKIKQDQKSNMKIFQKLTLYKYIKNTRKPKCQEMQDGKIKQFDNKEKWAQEYYLVVYIYI
jgi:hypothetical protein